MLIQILTLRAVSVCWICRKYVVRVETHVVLSRILPKTTVPGVYPIYWDWMLYGVWVKHLGHWLILLIPAENSQRDRL